MSDRQGSSRLPAIVIFGAIAFIAIVGVGFVLLTYDAGEIPRDDAPPAELR
jgi:hypothetical protein